MENKGWGPWKQEWYSICSANQICQKDCKLCRLGSYQFVWRLFFLEKAYKLKLLIKRYM